jgi:hypothetical protein
MQFRCMMHDSLALRVLLLIEFTALFGCHKCDSTPLSQPQVVAVSWADGSPCVEAEIQLYSRGEWSGQWSEGFEDVPLSAWLPVDQAGRVQIDDDEAVAFRVRTSLLDEGPILHRDLASTSEGLHHVTLPKPVRLHLKPGHLFPTGWVGQRTPVWADSLGWSMLGEVQWLAEDPPILYWSYESSINIWMDLPAMNEPMPRRGHWQDSLPWNGPWPDAIEWTINNP